MGVFRILHASDLHLSTVPYRLGIPDTMAALLRGSRPGNSQVFAVSTHDVDVVDAFAAFAYINRHLYDVIVLSGDLAATGSAGDLNAAVEFICQAPSGGYLAANGKPTLQAAGRPIALLPGNHDRFGSLFNVPPYPPGNGTFDTVFNAFWTAGQGTQEIWNDTKDGVSLIVLGADFSLSAGDYGRLPAGHLGQGKVYRERLNELRAATQQARLRCPSSVICWAIHFEPESRAAGLNLINERTLVGAAQSENVSVIMCGHTHATQVKTLSNNHTTVYVCGTTCQYYAPAKNDCCLLEIDASPARISVNCRRFSFSPTKGFLFVP